MHIDKKIENWKNIRNKITNDGINLDVLSYFCIPHTNRILDYYTPSSWPSPWEILSFEKLCKSTTTLLMYYTFKLSNIIGDYTLLLIDDSEDCYLILQINDTLYNYKDTKISTSDLNDVKIIQRFTDFEIKQYK